MAVKAVVPYFLRRDRRFERRNLQFLPAPLEISPSSPAFTAGAERISSPCPCVNVGVEIEKWEVGLSVFIGNYLFPCWHEDLLKECWTLGWSVQGYRQQSLLYLLLICFPLSRDLQIVVGYREVHDVWEKALTEARLKSL